jgi:hypothetical protein
MKNLTIAFVAALTLMSFGCKKKSASGEAMSKMSEYKDKMCACKDTACAQKVSEEMTKWAQDMQKDSKEPTKYSEEDQKKQAAIGEEMGKCMQKAMGAGGTMEPAGSAAGSAEGSAAAPAAAAGDLPAECNDYKAAIEKLSSCDKMPQAARDALKNAFDQASGSWASLPAEAKAGLATACKAGADAVMQSAKATCGW